MISNPTSEQLRKREDNRRYRARNADKIRLSHLEWVAKNKERDLAVRAEYAKNNPEKIKFWAKKTRLNNKEGCKKSAAKWAAKNPDKVKEKARRYYAKHKEACNARCLEWQSRNKGKVLAIVASRRAKKLSATPAWADMAAIEKIYTEARGMDMTVDHIIPLKHPLVCGLHVHWNMQILSREENTRKGNRYSPDMGNDQ